MLRVKKQLLGKRSTARKIIKDAGNKEKKINTKNQSRAQDNHKIQAAGSQIDHPQR